MRKNVKMKRKANETSQSSAGKYTATSGTSSFSGSVEKSFHYVCCLPPNTYLKLQHQFPSPISLSLWQLSVAWLIGHRPAILVPHLQLILEGVRSGGFGWAVSPFQPEGLVAEGGALQTRWLWGEGLRLQLKGVTKGAGSQAIQGLDTDPERRGMKRVMPVSQCHSVTTNTTNATIFQLFFSVEK